LYDVNGLDNSDRSNLYFTNTMYINPDSTYAIIFSGVASCPAFNRTVRCFDSLSGIKMVVIPDNACVNSLIFCATDTGTASVRYFGESHLTFIVMMLYISAVQLFLYHRPSKKFFLKPRAIPVNLKAMTTIYWALLAVFWVWEPYI